MLIKTDMAHKAGHQNSLQKCPGSCATPVFISNQIRNFTLIFVFNLVSNLVKKWMYKLIRNFVFCDITLPVAQYCRILNVPIFLLQIPVAFACIFAVQGNLSIFSELKSHSVGGIWQYKSKGWILQMN